MKFPHRLASSSYCLYILHCLTKFFSTIRHEITGTVREVGTDVKRFKVGDPVGVGTYVNSCRECEYCNDGLEVHCSKGSIYTFDGIDTDGTVTKGGYSSYIVVNERLIYPTLNPNVP